MSTNKFTPFRKGHLTQSSEVLQRLFENGKSPLSEQFIRWKMWAKWSDVVGKTMAEVTEPVSYQRGILYIWVKNSVWMQQLVFLRSQITETINAKLEMKFVRDIRFTLDRKAVPDTNQEELKNTLKKILPEES